MRKDTAYFVKTVIFTGMGLWAWSQACLANFYTVIGPDGRPIVIQTQAKPEQHKANVKAPPAVEQHRQVNDVTSKTPVANPNPVVATQTLSSATANQAITVKTQPVPVVDKNKDPEPTSHQALSSDVAAPKIRVMEKQVGQITVVPTRTVVHPVIVQPKAEKRSNEVNRVGVSATEVKQVEIVIPPVPTQINPKVVKTEPLLSEARVVTETKMPAHRLEQPLNTETKENKAETTPTPAAVKQNVVEIDGVQYVNSEYLEEREFNLEGKKRFYVMPEVGSGGGHNIHTVEREKGVSKSLLDRLWKKSDQPAEAVVLSTSYQRLQQQEVTTALEQSCFQDSKVTKAKILGGKNSDLGFWPVAPFKEKFVYEVAKLDSTVHNILVTSYASSKKSPQYYWPFVVFLDEKGCVLEGVSGFKTAQVKESAIHQAHIEGVLRKPDNAVYLFMTPLESALDIEDMTLSNQGQIKLSVIE